MITMPVDHLGLLEGARRGNGAALGALLDSYTAYLTVLARLQIGRRLQGKVEPGDIVQEAFLDAHRQFGLFQGTTEPEFRQWLRRILAGHLSLLCRRFLGAGRDIRLEQEIAVELDQSSAILEKGLAGSFTSPSQHASRREQATLLADALAVLPDDYREVLVLRHIEGLSTEQIAVRMDRSPNAVQKLWARALAELRRVMDVKQ